MWEAVAGAPGYRQRLLASAALGVVAVVALAALAPPVRADDGAVPPVSTGAQPAAETTETTEISTGHMVYLRADVFDDYGIGHIGGGFTLHEDALSAVSLWADAYAADAYDDASEDFQAGSLGLAYRRRLGEEDSRSSWGAHA